VADGFLDLGRRKGAGLAISKPCERAICSAKVPRRAGRRLEHVALGHRQTIGAQNEHTPPRLVPFGGPARLACSDQRLQQELQILDIRGRAVIEDHEIDSKLLHAPVLVRAE
jgi:hypothetical protein